MLLELLFVLELLVTLWACSLEVSLQFEVVLLFLIFDRCLLSLLLTESFFVIFVGLEFTMLLILLLGHESHLTCLAFVVTLNLNITAGIL